MRWTLSLLLLSAVGCGYRQTRMVACPETGCPPSYAESSPEGLKGPTRVEGTPERAVPPPPETYMPPPDPNAPPPPDVPPAPEPPPAP